MRLIWSKLASWRLFFLGKDLVLHFKQFQFVGPTFFNYIQHSKMQHFCSIFQLTRCIGESWLNVVFVVCSLGENLLIDLFYKNVYYLTLFNVPYTSGTAIRTSQSTTFFALSPKIVHFYLSNIDSNKLFFDAVSLLWDSRLVQIYSKICFDKIDGFSKL